MKRQTYHAAALSVTLPAACLLVCGPALASEPVVSRSAKALEALCISTQFDRRSLDAKVQSFSHRELPKPSLRKLSVYNEVGYALIVDHAPVTVTFGRRKSDDEVSRNCTVTIKDLDFAEANDLLQGNYNAEELDRFANGVSQIAVYRAAFPGYPDKMYLSVQTGSGLTALSLFEPPAGEAR
ncbi:MAG: hypothetical protein QNJ62_08785 [Methyloceanibacter sp.]|nr:hypothetical protein [Methyloceanibacter sp.]